MYQKDARNVFKISAPSRDQLFKISNQITEVHFRTCTHTRKKVSFLVHTWAK